MTDTINYQGVKPSFDMGRVMNRSFSGLFKNIKPILLATLICLVVSNVLSAPLLFMDASDPTALTQSPAYWIMTAISSLLGFLFFMFICIFTDYFAFASFTNSQVRFKNVFFKSLKLTLPLLFIVILYFISTYIGMIFLIVPGVIISVGWAIIGPSYLHEDTSLFGSFGRSWQLTSGYKWWVWLATIVMGILMTVMFTVLILIMAGVGVSGLAGADMLASSSVRPLLFIFGLLASLFMYLMFALYASFITALYTELRELKEGPLGETMGAIFD